ncbi:hypothetical protein AKI39_18410 [Bordetella sp. H567]|nr:hypothetical protein AKI39_18410 [Bordetella sp. H567]
MEGTSLKCPFVNSKYTFVANMEQPIDAGSNGTGTMTLESGVSNYTGVNCQIDVNPDFSSINGSIWCGNRHATLSQPAVHVMFANAVHGNGSFFIPQ